MAKVYFLLGTNMGDRKSNLSKVRSEIVSQFGTASLVSSIFESEAWGKTDQRSFLNQVIVTDTAVGPLKVLEAILAIEKNMGRKRLVKWGERIIDIDILFFGSEIINEPNLTVPHPAISERRFTLVPLVEIDPDFVHPLLGKTMNSLLADCNDPLSVIAID